MASYVGVSTGISVQQEVKEAMFQMKRNNAFSWMSMKIAGPNGNTVVMDKISKPKYTKQAAHNNNNIAASKTVLPQDIGLSGEPFIEVLGNLDLKQLGSAAQVCQHWKQVLSQNEDRILHHSAVANKLCTPSFDIKQYGFDSWKEYYLELSYAREHLKQVWDDFCSELPQGECRYIVYNFNCKNGKRVFLFILWAPDVCSVRHKMIYASTKVETMLILSKLGVQFEYQATSLDELEFANVQLHTFGI